MQREQKLLTLSTSSTNSLFAARGSSLIEFLICIPVILILFAGMLDFSRWMVANQTASRVAYEAAALGARLPDFDKVNYGPANPFRFSIDHNGVANPIDNSSFTKESMKIYYDRLRAMTDRYRNEIPEFKNITIQSSLVDDSLNNVASATNKIILVTVELGFRTILLHWLNLDRVIVVDQSAYLFLN